MLGFAKGIPLAGSEGVLRMPSGISRNPPSGGSSSP